LASASQLFTDVAYLKTLPSPPAGSVVHVVSADHLVQVQGAVIISRSAQEAYDHAVLATKLAKREKVVVYHYIATLDGSVQAIEDPESWINSSDTPVHTESDLFRSYETISLSLLKQTRRAQKPFEHKATESSRLVVNFLPYSINVENVIDISLASPLPDRLRFVAQKADEVVVVEGGSGKFGLAWSAVVDALDGLSCNIRSVLVASEGDVEGATHSSQQVSRIGTPATRSVSPTSISVPSAESTYTNLAPIDILNDPSKLSASESTSPLYAFGKAVALRQERQRLIDLAMEQVRAQGTGKEVHDALSAWLVARDTPEAESLGRKVEQVLGSGEIVELGKKHWAKRALWIVVSNAWAHDLASSGLHHALVSGLDINLLVYETSPSPFSPHAKQVKDRKKDLALYALNIGDVYVASVAVYADYAGVINAMREAEAYDGPGLVLAYLPWGELEDGVTVSDEILGPLTRLRETKRAVAGGWWPMFRWNPSAEDSKRFSLDSSSIKAALSDFLDRQSHLSQLTLAEPKIDVPQSAGERLVALRKTKARQAYDALVNSLDGPGLLVLYASDGGNAEKVAKRLVGRAKMRGVAASIRVLDEVAHNIAEAFAAETNILIITSTAGQGEAPQNGREFYKAVAKLDSSLDTRVAVFGMGDSNYWPRKEDYVYYNKPAKDIANRLSAHVQELVPLGLGDDSDPDGYLTGYKPFEAALWRALGVDSVEVVEAQEETVANEHIKIASDYLRGTILEGLADKSTGAIGASDAQLTKFHGTYMQDDRDIRDSLKSQGLEPAYSFMIRCRMPGGVCTPDQWMQMDRIADEHGNSTFKLTTRQTFQFHGIVKKHLKPAMQAINKSLLDTIAACGDVNRNLQLSVNPRISAVHETVYNFSKAVSEHLLPSTNAYHEIWLDKKKVSGDAVQDFEPLYGPTYLPRKFKIAVAVPPDNAVDVFTNDVGFIAIVENDQVLGYNVTVGGGMGVTHSNKKTYPRLGDVLGFVKAEDGIAAAEGIMLTQRDNGNRADRKNAVSHFDGVQSSLRKWLT
jgi:sulfite reductase (NADPH) hemoprotein beta-component